MTSRRGFLGALAAGAAAFALDPERALWVPGAKTISIPKPANVILCPIFQPRFFIPRFVLGDVVTFRGDPGRYIVTAAYPETQIFAELRHLSPYAPTYWHSTLNGPRESVFSRV